MKIFTFITTLGIDTEVSIINAKDFEEATNLLAKQFQGKMYSSVFIKSMEVEEFMRDLKLPTVQLVAPEEPKPTLDNLASLLSDNGYTVTKHITE